MTITRGNVMKYNLKNRTRNNPQKVFAMLPQKFKQHCKLNGSSMVYSPPGGGGFALNVGNTTARALRKWSHFKG